MLTNYAMRIAPAFLLATILALIWTYLTRHMYNYNLPFPVFFGLTTFPLVAWTLALTTGYFIIQWLIKKIGTKRTAIRLSVAVIAYAVAVVIAETVGYHLVGIQNIGTSQYAGLPLCDCLHAPMWMQVGYFTLGPLHWLLMQKAFIPSNLWYFSARSDKIV